MVGYNGQIEKAKGTNAGIVNTYQYVMDRYGSSWVYTNECVLPVPAYLQRVFSAKLGTNDTENCVISSMATILKYYQENKGYTNIPSNIYAIYDDVLKIAYGYGYDPEIGTPPSKINNIVADSFAKYGYSVKGNTDFVISYAKMVNEINNNRPFLFSNANGYYYRHTFVVKGYREYTKGAASKKFLSVNDNWTTDERWYDYSAFYCCGSITRMSK